MQIALNSAISKWFEKAPNWQKDLFNQLSANLDISTQKLEDTYNLCQKEYQLADSSRSANISIPTFHECEKSENTTITTLKKISSIQGVGSLAPKTPIEFTSNLNIVYGENGSGKSSYIKILKNVCGAKGAKPIIGNIFKEKPPCPSAEVTFLQNDKDKIINWSEGAIISDDIVLMQIYDSDNASIYVTQDNESMFEPEILAIFSKMAEICERFNKRLTNENQNVKSELINVPTELSNTGLIKKYNSISSKKNIDDLKKLILWNGLSENELNELTQSLIVSNPLERAKEIRDTISSITVIKDEILQLYKAYDDKSCESLLSLKSELINKKQLADEDALIVFSSSKLDGISNDSWKSMWNAAREYSEKYAYMNKEFPYIEQDAVCVLCHQPLLGESKSRVNSFECFIKSKLQLEAQKAQEAYTNSVNSLKPITEFKILELRMQAINASEEIITQSLYYYKRISDRKESLLLERELEKISPNVNKDEVTSYYSGIISKLTEKAENFEKAVSQFDQQKQKQLDLTSQKWLYGNINLFNKKEMMDCQHLSVQIL